MIQQISKTKVIQFIIYYTYQVNIQEEEMFRVKIEIDRLEIFIFRLLFFNRLKFFLRRKVVTVQQDCS